MDSSSRRVQAERNRNRLPPKRKAYRWTRRIVGVIATIAFIGVGVAIAQMVLPDKDGTDASAATPTATPVKEKATKKKSSAKHKKKAAKPKGPTKAQREALAAAVATVREKGYTTLRQSDYDPKASFRVLLGRPVGDAAGGSRAFFFAKDQFLGNDALNPSTKLSVAKKGKLTVTLSYGVYAQGDTAGDPSGRKRVRFRLENGQIHALDTIPLDSARFQRPKS
jgi:LppP/LprE lipoprotein